MSDFSIAVKPPHGANYRCGNPSEEGGVPVPDTCIGIEDFPGGTGLEFGPWEDLYDEV
jgi:hypothetical protein